jgi:predicted outer membrane protein
MRYMGLIAALALISTLAVALAGCDPLDRAELKREVESIGSLAAEGEILASDTARDRTKATFVRVHAEELSSNAEESAEKINDADVATGLNGKAGRAIRLATDTADALGELVVSPGDEHTARSVQLELHKLSDEADGLSSSL